MQVVANRKLTAAERLEVTEFVEWLYRESGAPTWAAFARQCEVSEWSLAAWRNAKKSGPSALHMIRMLRGSGVLRERAGEHVIPMPHLASPVSGHLDTITAGIARLDEEQRAAVLPLVEEMNALLQRVSDDWEAVTEALGLIALGEGRHWRNEEEP